MSKQFCDESTLVQFSAGTFFQIQLDIYFMFAKNSNNFYNTCPVCYIKILNLIIFNFGSAPVTAMFTKLFYNMHEHQLTVKAVTSLYRAQCNTVKSWFLEHPREKKICTTETSGDWNIEGKITVKQIQGKQLLVRVIGVFEKSMVRGIEIPL